MKNSITIDTALVQRLITLQFPQWQELPIRPVARMGWDNRTFHLGDQMLVRMPSAAKYDGKVAKEFQWLPKLAPSLPLPIPMPVALGQPGEGYPWKWVINRWLEGESAATAPITDPCQFARDLAHFLTTLQQIDAAGGPDAGEHNFSRGGPLNIYDAQTRQALTLLEGQIDTATATAVWEAALAPSWDRPLVWLHGDVSQGNLLVKNGKLCAVIDFGALAIGDPACDLAIAWTFFTGESRTTFKDAMNLDEGTWNRGRGWALWKALIVASGLCSTNNVEAERSREIIDDILKD